QGQRSDWTSVEVSGVHCNGHEIPLEVSFSAVEQDGEQLFTGIVRDRTEQKHLEEALRESEQRFRDLFESLPDALLVEDLDGTILDANPAACRLYGLSRPQLQGSAMHTLVPPEYGEQMKRALEDLVAGERKHIEGYCRAANGQAVPVEILGWRIRYAEQPALMLYLRDITEHKRAQESIREREERYRTLIEHVPEAIVVLDVEKGCFVDCNTNAEAFYGLSRTDLLKMNPVDVSPERQPDGRLSAEVAYEYIKQAAEGGTPVFEWVHVNVRGEEVPSEIRLVRLPSVDRVLVRGSITGIAERKEFEKELIEAREKAEELNRLKTTFLTNMSHEIRTPLTAIIGFSAILAGEASDDQKELVEMVEQSGKRLLNTLNTVLDLSMLEAGSLTLENEWFDMVEAVRENMQGGQSFAKEKGVHLEFIAPEYDVPVFLDRTCLERIVNHLIDNAIKFTDSGTVTVTVKADPAYVRVRVADTGVGIDEAFLPHLFDAFKQESTGLTRSYGGTGLGLAVTKRMVTLMGGEIVVESQKEEGSVFEVAFANPVSASEASEEIHAGAACTRKVRILAVEDSPEIQMLLEYMLSDFYDIEATSDEEGALLLAQQKKYDLIFMDINLGGERTGEDVLASLRELPGYEDIPVVAMTAYALLEDRERFLDSGFDGYLSKPFTMRQAQNMVQHMLSTKGKRPLQGFPFDEDS
ncbi:MAG: PAS domain S-box protein, partial [Rhodothermales bacterium]